MIKSKQHTVTHKKFSNGAEGLFIHVPEATVMDFEFNFRAGHYLVPQEIWETPHIMEHLSLGANEIYPSSRIFDAEFKKNGAFNNAYTDIYHILYDAECADFEWDRILDLIILAISKPKFLKEEFAAECGNVRDELVRNSNNYGRALAQTMYEEFGMLSMRDSKRIKTMENVSLQNVVDHYKATHTTSNLRFIIAGNLKGRMTHIETVISKIKLPKGRGRIEMPDEVPRKLEHQVFIPKKEVENIFFDLETFQKIIFDDSNWPAADVANTLLTETFHSKIFGEAREKGLVYSMGSGFGIYKSYTDWGIGCQVQKANLPALTDIMVRELKKLMNGDVSEEDIEGTKQYIVGSFQRGAQTVSSVVDGYSGRFYYENQVRDYYAFPDRLMKVKKEQVVEVMKSMFELGVWGMGMLGTADEALRNQIEEKVSVLWRP